MYDQVKKERAEKRKEELHRKRIEHYHVTILDTDAPLKFKSSEPMSDTRLSLTSAALNVEYVTDPNTVKDTQPSTAPQKISDGSVQTQTRLPALPSTRYSGWKSTISMSAPLGETGVKVKKVARRKRRTKKSQK